MKRKSVLKHYSRSLVKEEIAEYCKHRWVALEGAQIRNSRVFIRYRPDGTPLKITCPDDVVTLIGLYRGIKVRTIYASISVYKSLNSAADVEMKENVVAASPIWDIDGSLERWKPVVEVAKTIVDFLEKEGVVKSVFIKWSGEGMHIHIHERAFSNDVLSRYHPLDVAYSIVEYTLRKLKVRLHKIVRDSGGMVKVENVIDMKRVFTAPLSLHRRHDLCCVCLKPEQLEDFDISWAFIDEFKHNRDWRLYEIGEADELALKAMTVIGGYPGWKGRGGATRIALEELEPKMSKVGRFQVMALLQAARYYLLTGDLERAKSFGLNRAIFYAWAKHHGAILRHKAHARYQKRSERPTVRMIKIFEEEVPVSDSGWFMMGGIEQRPSDYDRQVASRIYSIVPYEKAWRAALEYLRRFPRRVLTDPQRFYQEAYLPVRDRFVEKVVKKYFMRQATLDELFEN